MLTVECLESGGKYWEKNNPQASSLEVINISAYFLPAALWHFWITQLRYPQWTSKYVVIDWVAL